MTSEPDHGAAAPDGGDPSYGYKPSLIGAPYEFVLKGGALHWQIGRNSGRIPFDRVRRVRLSFRPATMQSQRFLAEIWSTGQPKMQIVSVSWRSVIGQERQDAAYRAFIVELHRRLAAAGSTAQFVAGMPFLLYWIGVAVFAGVMIATAVLAVHAMLQGQWTGAAIVGVFFLIFAYQLGIYFYRNRPLRYRPDDLPGHILPRG
jgi:hypothetical protein